MESTAMVSQFTVCPKLSIGRSLMVLMVLSGCATIGRPVVAESVPRADPPRIKLVAQLIVKFRDPLFDPARQGYLKELARDTGVTFVYVRTMSGDAHVLRIENVVDADHFLRVVEGLAKRPEVEYAEPDRRMQHLPLN